MKSCLLMTLILVCGVASCEKVRSLADRFRKKPVVAEAPASQAGSTVTELSDSTYAAFLVQPDKLVIIDFYATWCGPCQKLSPLLERISSAYGGTVVVGKVNVDRCGEVAAKEGIQGIPDVRLIRNGKVVDKFVGLPAENDLRRRIATHAKGLSVLKRSNPQPGAPATGDGKSGDGKPVEPAIRPMPKDWVPPSFGR
jgi:thioredoxin